MSLLTPTESHAFQSFLSSLAPADSPPEWAMYPPANQPDPIDIPQGKEALAKATKDLMSLDADRWQPLFDQQRYQHPYQNHFHAQLQSQTHPSFPLPKQATSLPLLPPPTSAYPSTRSRHSVGDDTNASASSSTGRTSPPPTAKRTLAHDPPGSNKRPRSTSSQSPTVIFPRLPGQQPVLSNGSGKPSLLSPSQKKANHIQSEQKRRANIRRGYEKLCETVPALREAIREEEEAAAEGGSDDRAGGANGKGRGKRGRGRGKDSGEKVDGRAGPRSENVVLGKSEYMSCLLFIHSFSFSYRIHHRPYIRTRIPTVASSMRARRASPRPSFPHPLHEQRRNTALGTRVERRRRQNRQRRRRRRRRRRLRPVEASCRLIPFRSFSSQPTCSLSNLLRAGDNTSVMYV
jgi:hypothetical protein